MEDHAPLVAELSIPLIDEPLQEAYILRLSMRGESRDLPLVLHRPEAADMGHVGVIVTQRVVGGRLMQIAELPVADLVDEGTAPVPTAIDRNDQGVLEATGEVGGRDVREVMVNERDGARHAELFAEDPSNGPAAIPEAGTEKRVIAGLQERQRLSIPGQRTRRSLDQPCQTRGRVLEPARERLQLVDEHAVRSRDDDRIEVLDRRVGQPQHLRDGGAGEPDYELEPAETFLVHRRKDTPVLDDRGTAVTLGRYSQYPHNTSLSVGFSKSLGAGTRQA